jgi:hypothetical protein
MMRGGRRDRVTDRERVRLKGKDKRQNDVEVKANLRSLFHCMDLNGLCS